MACRWTDLDRFVRSGLLRLTWQLHPKTKSTDACHQIDTRCRCARRPGDCGRSRMSGGSSDVADLLSSALPQSPGRARSQREDAARMTAMPADSSTRRLSVGRSVDSAPLARHLGATCQEHFQFLSFESFALARPGKILVQLVGVLHADHDRGNVGKALCIPEGLLQIFTRNTASLLLRARRWFQSRRCGARHNSPHSSSLASRIHAARPGTSAVDCVR